MKLDGGSLLARTMCDFGVDTVFTLHGGHLDGAYKALTESNVRLVDTRHEQAAGIAATGYARATGKVGVCMVTAGGGVTNAVTAIANAYADCVPSVFIGGAPPLRDFDALPVNSGYDQMSLMGGITVWSHRVTQVEHIPYVIGKAMRLAQAGRGGPVYLDMPSDVLFALADEADVKFTDPTARIAAPAPDPEAIAEVIETLLAAERPVILAGGGVVASGSSKILEQFAELTGIPVLTNAKARGALPTDHPLYGRGFASLAAAAGRGAGTADAVLVLGARKGIYTGGPRRSFIAADAKLMQIDVDAAEFTRIRAPELGIVADCGHALRALKAAAGNGAWKSREAWVKALCAAPEPAEIPASGQPTPGDLAAKIASRASENTIFVADGGETPAWLDGVAVNAQDRHWLGHGYIGIMGEGLPLAVGAQVAKPDTRVVLFSGDGSIGFNFAEFDTMVRHDLPVIVIVNNDQQWAMSAHGQDLIYGEGNRYVSDLAPSRYDIAASGFGAHPELVTDISELDAAWDRAVASGKPACINVMTKRTMAQITQRLMGRAAEGMVSDEGLARVPYADVLEV